MSIKSLSHVCLKTTGLDTTADFYCGALGLTRMFDFTRNGKVIGFYLKTGNETFVEVFLADEIDGIDKQALNHFCLEAESLEALHQELSVRGYSPGPIKMGCDHTAQFWMKDPNGLALEFQQYSEKSAQRTGQNVEVNW